MATAATPAATTPTASEIEGDVLNRLPQVPAPTAATAHPTSPDGTGGAAFLTAVFDDAQAM